MTDFSGLIRSVLCYLEVLLSGNASLPTVAACEGYLSAVRQLLSDEPQLVKNHLRLLSLVSMKNVDSDVVMRVIDMIDASVMMRGLDEALHVAVSLLQELLDVLSDKRVNKFVAICAEDERQHRRTSKSRMLREMNEEFRDLIISKSEINAYYELYRSYLSGEVDYASMTIEATRLKGTERVFEKSMALLELSRNTLAQYL